LLISGYPVSPVFADMALRTSVYIFFDTIF